MNVKNMRKYFYSLLNFQDYCQLLLNKLKKLRISFVKILKNINKFR